MNPLETYLDRLQEIRATKRGTPELSYRAALENLLNAVGRDLDPVVQVTAELADSGAGRPDFGFMEKKSGNLRGVVEVKPVEEDTPETADGSQVARYWQRYGYVLVTNYRDFLLVVKRDNGKPRVEGRYQLAPNRESFWAAKPRTLAKEHAESFTDFLAGVMTRAAPITRAKDLAADLARHAREARRRLVRQDISALAPLQHAMEQALGLHFHGEDGQAFFQSSLVQTLFYGLFSGWMLWRQGIHRLETFNWKDASEHLALPLIGDLYEEIARPKRLADLDLREPLEWATNSLNRVAEEEFFKTFDADHAITLFYEPFLQAFDPKLRKELGVWYTPPEIVQYMVGRVDQLLRSELKIADGLADDQVYVLDPAAGTGSYLVEVAKTIHRTLKEQGHGSLAAARVKKALCTRIFGFEILPAPYVVAHLQLGVLLRSLGTKLVKGERAEVYLTNALTGWEPPKEPKTVLLFPELAKEIERAGRVKREAPILVILGNPPYNAFAGVAEEEEADLIEPYKSGLNEKWGVRRQLLDDLYIRFYRLAEKRIAEIGERGIVSFISNYSWLDGLSHPVMRERLLKQFDQIWIDNCNGDKYKTGKRTPDGRPDQSMFTTDEHPVGIQVGTAIATLVKLQRRANGTSSEAHVASVRYRDLWGLGNEKRKLLVASLRPNSQITSAYSSVVPRPIIRWVLVKENKDNKATKYESWCSLPEIFAEVYKGVQPGRGGALVFVDREPLVRQMRDYYDSNLKDHEIRERYPSLMQDEARYDAIAMRRLLLGRGARFQEQSVLEIQWLPFDLRWLYWEKQGKLLNEKRTEFMAQVGRNSMFLACAQKPRKGKVSPPLVTQRLGSYYVFDPYTTYFPARFHLDDIQGEKLESGIKPNLLRHLCEEVGTAPFESDHTKWTKAALSIGDNLFFHVLAVLWSPGYRDQHDLALRQDWPRVPIPAEAKILDASSDLGRKLADLLLPERPVPGVTTGKLRPELRTLGVPTKFDGDNIDPATDLKVGAGWGFWGHKNAVMCGKGKAVPNKADPKNAVDIFINDKVCWANVPLDVWTLTIGGYPVIKKWLSYREYKVLGRPLKLEEVTYITDVIRRLKALLLLGDELDANYRAVHEKTVDFKNPSKRDLHPS